MLRLLFPRWLTVYSFDSAAWYQGKWVREVTLQGVQLTEWGAVRLLNPCVCVCVCSLWMCMRLEQGMGVLIHPKHYCLDPRVS